MSRSTLPGINSKCPLHSPTALIVMSVCVFVCPVSCLQIHNLHQSLRDLRSDQIRLGGDLDTEVLRRNR